LIFQNIQQSDFAKVLEQITSEKTNLWVVIFDGKEGKAREEAFTYFAEVFRREHGGLSTGMNK
jgi:hypothetical protein